jgi:hypothetical protein
LGAALAEIAQPTDLTGLSQSAGLVLINAHSILRSVPVSLPTIPVGLYPAIRQPGVLLKYPSGNTVIEA